MDDVEIVSRMPLFAPSSAGSFRDLAELTILATNQIFPLLLKFVNLSGTTTPCKLISAEALCSDELSLTAATRLKTLLDTYGSDKATAHNYH